MSDEKPLLGSNYSVSVVGGRGKQEDEEECWGIVACIEEDVKWAWNETHLMCMELGCCGVYDELSVEEQMGLKIIKWNPLYWAGMVLGTPCLVLGAWVHTPFGQGRKPVRDDEMKVEHQARTQWILMTDGPFALSVVFDLVYLAWYRSTKVAVGLGVDSCYILGNVLFLDAMRRRSRTLTRLAIVCNGVFAAGLLALLIGGLYFAVDDREASAWVVFDWICRSVAVFFFVLATCIYARLWHAYDHDKVHPDDHSCLATTLQALFIAAAAAFIWALFLFAAFIDGPTALWAAIA